MQRSGVRTGLGMVLAVCAALAGWGLFGAAAQAQEAPPPEAGSCLVCHGPGGRGEGSIPSIGGLASDQIAEALHAYRDGSRGGTVMPRLAGGLTDAAIAALAVYFADPAHTDQSQSGVP